MSDEVKAVSAFLFFLSLGAGTGWILVNRLMELRHKKFLYETLYRAEVLNREFFEDQFMRATKQGKYAEQT